MQHNTLRYTIKPRGAFGTPLAGDTLFGQICWALRERLGNDWLVNRLTGYCKGRPFLVISDALPHDFLPLPSLPSRFFRKSTEDRTILKEKRWLPVAACRENFRDWQGRASSDREAAETVLRGHGIDLNKPALQKILPQSHNSINRATGTTGEGMFAPYSLPQIWFHPAMRFDLYVVIDTEQIRAEEVTVALTDIGQSGYGRDASIGLGKFEIIDCFADSASSAALEKIKKPNAYLSLAPCAPQGLGFDRAMSFYRLLTRFGRHGNVMALSGNPFKRPILLAATGGVFVPARSVFEAGCLYLGQGLGDVSTIQPEAVSQGYAPVWPLCMEVSQ